MRDSEDRDQQGFYGFVIIVVSGAIAVLLSCII